MATRKQPQPSQPLNPQVGDVVGVKQGSKTIDCTVTRRRVVKRGAHKGQVEFTCAPITPGMCTRRGRDAIGYRCIGTSYFVQPTGAQHSDQAKGQAVGTMYDGLHKRDQAAARRRMANADTAEAMQVQAGDEITVRGKYGERWVATVTQVNARTGKVGIAANADAVEARERRAEMHARINYHAGTDLSTSVRRVRWLPPGAITKVTRAGQVVWTCQGQ